MTAMRILAVSMLAVLGCPCCPTSQVALAQGCCASPTRGTDQEQKDGSADAATQSPEVAKPRTATLRIDGMTCGGCAAAVQKAIQGVAGVQAATVDFERRLATVQCETGVGDESLVQAVTNAGFKATPVTLARVYLRVEGMTCEACVDKVKNSLGKVDGASDIAVDLTRKRAAMTVESGRVKPEALTEAIRIAGFKAATVPTEKVCLRVTGMTCDKCVQGIAGSISRIDGVEDVTVDLKTGIACVTREKEKAGDEALRRAVSDAGGTRHRFSAEVLGSQGQGGRK